MQRHAAGKSRLLPRLGAGRERGVFAVIGAKAKLMVVGVVATLAVLAGSSSASAAATTLTADDQATIQLDGAALEVTGLVQCTAGDDAFISATVLQSKGNLVTSGGGSISFTCTGSLQPWTIEATAFIGSYKSGHGSLVVNFFDNTDNTSASVNQTVQIKNK
jgi:hypothetical protein